MTQALHAEWTKFRTVAGSWWLLLAAAFSCSPSAGGCAAASSAADPAKLSLTGVLLGQVVTALIAVLAIGGEYSSGMIRLTLTATPRRLTAYAAKALVTLAAATSAAVLAVGGSVLAGRLILPGRGLSAANGYLPISLANAAYLRAAVGSVLYLTLIALLAFGITTAVRDSAAGIGVVLGLLLLLPIVSIVTPDHVLARHLEQLSPMTAGLYIQVTRGVDTLPLTPWQGLGVTALWAAAALALGAAVLRLRDA